MAILSDDDRKIVHSTYMKNVSSQRGTFATLTKENIRDAVNAIDQWISDNTASFNQSIPLPARSALTTEQKEDLFLIVLKRRVNGD